MAGIVSHQQDVNEAMGILNSGQKENPDDIEHSKKVLKSATPKQKDKAREVLGLKPKVNRKGGGKITYRMTGGQVVASSYDK
jgi:hypothetical protein